ncbi:hypothetical protein JZ751_025578 [Albula glossodonta]|uniref:C-type lectin domain-containing protein n=1 Tax=Albula glossodonta TaxID=121402 RepID=A0A8T2MXH4_9TELE|nr:hypothetical protein JZ751_025576 [Albula glossodonta]KAG9330367.1 hypothetical protein JZ751_025577 [Albula glossodonta]KAG9330368.1 hypothetical protein JZ751_025578 [Albula glossodonta]
MEVQEAAKEAGKRVWIGLFRESWRWSDQSNSSYRNWNETQPDNRRGNESCAEADFGLSGTWNDLECKSTRYFICSAVRKRFVMTVELNTTSDMNMKDSVVSEAILQQIQQNLEEQGIPVQKLNWRKQPDGETFQRKAEDEEKKEGCEKSEV